MRAHYCPLLIALLLGTALIIEGAQVKPDEDGTPAPTSKDWGYCNRHKGCDTCTRDPRGICGWCVVSSGSNFCVEGTSRGPDAGMCDGWNWYPESCSAPTPAPTEELCRQHVLCDTCVYEKGCGYCESIGDGVCMAGTDSGPYARSCPDKEWAYGSQSQCPQGPPVPPPGSCSGSCGIGCGFGCSCRGGQCVG